MHNATILEFPDVFRLNNGGNWNPAPVALPDGRVRVMVHTGFAGFLGDNQTLGGWSGEVIIEAASWKGYGTFRLNFHRFDRFELDLRGHTQVWGAAFSCLRLKWAEMVLM